MQTVFFIVHTAFILLTSPPPPYNRRTFAGVIDATGHVAYKSKPGPFGFKPEELKNAVARVAASPVKQ